MIPDRDANSDDPVIHPYGEDRSSANLYRISVWLIWRLTDPELVGDLRDLMELEAVETHALAELTQAMEGMAGETLEEKMAIPAQRDTLRALSLHWMRCQAALIAATTAHLDRYSPTNGH
jgi:hypothetical protein